MRREFLIKVETFLAKTGLTPTELGKKAVGNGNLIFTLRKGGDCLMGTAEKVEAFMNANKNLQTRAVLPPQKPQNGVANCDYFGSEGAC